MPGGKEETIPHTQKTIGQGQSVLFSEEYDITEGTRNRPLSVYAVG